MIVHLALQKNEVFFSKCDQIRSFLRFCSHLLNKSLMENFIFYAVLRKMLDNKEVALQRCSWEKIFWKYAANLQENTHAEVRF